VRRLFVGASFTRALKRIARRRPDLRDPIEDALCRLSIDPFDSSLRTHKLKGQFKGTFACSVEYHTRILFELVPDPDHGDDAILLIDIGSHEDVY